MDMSDMRDLCHSHTNMFDLALYFVAKIPVPHGLYLYFLKRSQFQPVSYQAMLSVKFPSKAIWTLKGAISLIPP